MFKVKKLGTIDLDIVESNPIIFKGKAYLLEYIRQAHWLTNAPTKTYHGNTLGKPYCRLRDLDDLQSFSEPFAVGYCFGNAYSDGDQIVVTVTRRWGDTAFYALESTDMIHWTEPHLIYENADMRCYNSSMIKVGNKYINALEVGPRLQTVDCVAQNYNIFAASEDLQHWEVLPGRSPVPGWTIRYYDGWYFMFGLIGDYQKGFNTHIFRSRDLQEWQSSPHNPVFVYDESDRKIHPQAKFDASQLQEIANAVNINFSDIDMCDYRDKLVISYSWGDQKGHEFLALAEADCSEREFLFACFDEK